jgi:hypothetical protein
MGLIVLVARIIIAVPMACARRFQQDYLAHGIVAAGQIVLDAQQGFADMTRLAKLKPVMSAPAPVYPIEIVLSVRQDIVPRIHRILPASVKEIQHGTLQRKFVIVQRKPMNYGAPISPPRRM